MKTMISVIFMVLEDYLGDIAYANVGPEIWTDQGWKNEGIFPGDLEDQNGAF